MKNPVSAKRENVKSLTERDAIKLLILLLVFIFLVILSYPKELEGDFSSGIQKFTLDNGLIVVIKELPYEELVNIGAFVRAGSSTEGKFLGSGISHLIEHMLFKGTETRGVGEIEREIKSYGGRMEGFTSFDYTAYFITLPAQHFDKAIEIIGDCLLNPSFDEEELEKEREVILKEVNLNLDNPTKYLHNLLYSVAYSVHPYRYPVIGKPQFLKKLTRDDLIEYHRLMYNPGNLIIVVVGNVDTKKALSKIKTIFNNFSLQFSNSSSFPLPEEPRQMVMRKLVKKADVKLDYFKVAFHSVEVANRKLYALDLLSTVLGEGESSRFNRVLNQKKKLVTSINAYNFTPRYPGLFIISGTTTKNLEEAIEAIFTEIEKIKKNSITEEELKRAKKQLKADYFFRQETLEGQAYDLGLNELLVGDFNFSKIYIEEIDKVKLEDIQRVAKEYLTRANSITCVLTSSSATGDVKQKEKKESWIFKETLNNGLVVLLKEDHSLPLVSIVCAFQGGVRAEGKNKRGISYLTAQSLSQAVKVKGDLEAFASIEAMGGKITSFSGNNSFGMSLSLLSSDVEEGLELVADILINPHFSRKRIEREKEKMFARLKKEEDDIFSQGFRLLRRKLFKRHPYRFHYLGTRESLAKITTDDVINFYNRFVVPDNTVLSIFGDIDRENVLAKVKNIFAQWERGEFRGIDSVEEPILETIIEFTEPIFKEQSLVILGFPGTSIYNEDRYSLELISSILSGAGGRLYKRIRDELGLAYTLGAFSVAGIDCGYYSLYVATDYDNLERVKRELLNELRRLKEEIVKDDELRIAKEGLIGENMISLQGNSSLAFRASLDELYGLGFDNYTRYSKRINEITAEEIKRVANKYFNLNAYCVITLTQR